MTDQKQVSLDAAGGTSAPSPSQIFVWHPIYKGRDVASVRREVLDEVRRDQRAYELSLEAAEQDESASLQAIVKLDSRWCAYDLGWTEANVDQLSDRVIAIELERERRQEMFPVREMRDSLTPVSTRHGVQAAAEESISGGPDIPRWVYVLVSVLVVIGLIALLVQEF